MDNTENLGVISSKDQKDYLFRISMKALVVNNNGDILVVKESGRDWWDMPGGGVEHGETVKDAIARELHEEILLNGDFTYDVIDIDDPGLLRRIDAWQIRVVFLVKPTNIYFEPGSDGDEVEFKKPEYFQKSTADNEQVIYKYWQKAKSHNLV